MADHEKNDEQLKALVTQLQGDSSPEAKRMIKRDKEFTKLCNDYDQSSQTVTAQTFDNETKQPLPVVSRSVETTQREPRRSAIGWMSKYRVPLAGGIITLALGGTAATVLGTPQATETDPTIEKLLLANGFSSNLVKPGTVDTSLEKRDSIVSFELNNVEYRNQKTQKVANACGVLVSATLEGDIQHDPTSAFFDITDPLFTGPANLDQMTQANSSAANGIIAEIQNGDFSPMPPVC